MTEHPRVRIGVSGRRPHWRGHFYPEGLPQTQELPYIAARMPTAEIRSTFRGPQPRTSFLKWRDDVPADFVFAVKAPQAITHVNRLRGAETLVLGFCASVLPLQEKLGPVLWQLPRSMGFERDTFEAFLALLPHSVDETRRLAPRFGVTIDPFLEALPDAPMRHALEVRNPDFGRAAPLAEHVELLRRHGVAAAVSSWPEWPLVDDVTADFVYVRLHAGDSYLPDGYPPEALERWARRANGWADGSATPDGRGRDVYVYFESRDSTSPPFDAMELQRRVAAGRGAAA